MSAQRVGGEHADVLIVTAVKDEWDAVLAVDTGAKPGSTWEKHTGSIGLEVAFREFATEAGILRVAVTQALGMGGANAVIASAQLLKDYDVRCLAMCGVCAGHRGDVALGDVIIADRLWEYDTGKLKVELVDGVRVEREQGDMEMYRLHPPAWKHAAERFEVDRGAAWLALRPRSYEAQGDWILERLLEGVDPAADPEQSDKCASFDKAIARLWKRKLLEDGTLVLTEDGRKHIQKLLLLHRNVLPVPRPLETRVGPIASGAKVIEDEHIFARLAAPVREVLGVEMEAAAIGALAYAQGLPYSLVVKAVMDHADPDKSDNFKPFAARASAEVLIAFLRWNMPPRNPLDLVPGASPLSSYAPVYENDEVRGLAEQLDRARLRKKALEDAGANTAEVEREILDLRRRLREGGQLRAGDALENERYLLLERIGRGGFASVWAALDRKNGERVAIKVLHPDLAREPSRRERFFRGARVMAGLSHPAVVRVWSPHGEDGGYHYFVMELVEGEDLHRAVAGGRLPREETVPLILRLGDALAAAHERGIVHRDVKPANVLLDASRAPRLTDFDLVAAKDTTGGTRTGAMGTFLFTAPEQLGKAKEADARADVYALGMTAIFCLHGADLPDIAVRRPDIVIDELPCGDALKRVLVRAIEIDREARFSDARQFCSALRRAASLPSAPREDTAGTSPARALVVGSKAWNTALPERAATSRRWPSGRIRAGLLTLLAGGLAGWLLTRMLVPTRVPRARAQLGHIVASRLLVMLQAEAQGATVLPDATSTASAPRPQPSLDAGAYVMPEPSALPTWRKYGGFDQ
jgi:nucleoside phosphorylase